VPSDDQSLTKGRPTVDTASAAMLVESLAVHVRALREHVQESDQVRLEALVAGLGPVLESVAHSDDPADVALPVMQARALLEMLEDSLPCDSSAARQLVLQSIASMQALLGVPGPERAIYEDAEEPKRPPAVARSKGDPRIRLASSANYEVMLLSDLLLRHVAANDPGAEIAAIARGVLTRIHTLSDIIFEAVIQDGAEREDLDTLQRKLGEKVR
jgi:hypothetical protein